ncbi:NAC domain superfamily [Abeliophyllum distichum]|uniref:NAC domain superfamily n=1 Tax=Abeliophyllum distichum TaxID=126358 RepID=A0ABD1VC58_9LAMI
MRRMLKNENPFNSNHIPNNPNPNLVGTPCSLEAKVQCVRDLYDLITSNKLIPPLEKPVLDQMLYYMRQFINANSSNSSSILSNSNLVVNRSISNLPVGYRIISLPPVVNPIPIINPNIPPNNSPVVNPNNPNPPVDNASIPPMANPIPVINPNVAPNNSPVVNPNNPNPPVVNVNIPPMVNPNSIVNHLVVYQNLLNSIANCGNPFNSNQILSNIYEINPEKLADDYGMNPKKEWFFFTLRGRKYKDESILNRVVGDGY